MNRDEENGLIQRSLNGEVDAFGELVNEYKGRIFAIAYQITGNRADADDLSQEAFIKAYHSLRGFRKESNFYTWLCRISINLCINHLKKKRRSPTVSFDDPTATAPKEELNGKVLPAEGQEISKLVYQAIASLSLPLRTALVLVVFNDLTHREAAEIAGCSEGTISWRVFKARRYLRKKLADYF